MIDGLLELFRDPFGLLWFDARCQHIGSGGGQLLEHALELLNRLALTENDLGETAAQIAMVVDAGVAQILEGKPLKLLDGLIRG